jgi:hypothetical protein
MLASAVRIRNDGFKSAVRSRAYRHSLERLLSRDSQRIPRRLSLVTINILTNPQNTNRQGFQDGN